MPSLEKLRASMHVCSLEMKEKLKVELSFTEKSFIIYFIEPLSDINLQEIKNIFFPYISSDFRVINMNYIYIKTIYLDACNLLKFTLYNPLSTSIFTIIFNHFAFKTLNIFAKSVPSFKYLNLMTLEIKRRQNNQISKNINNFIKVINLFYDFRSIGREYNNIINEIFLKAFAHGLIYYDKSMKDYNTSQIKINLIPKDVQKEINESLNNITTELTEPVNMQFEENNSSDFENENENKNLAIVNDEIAELQIDTLTTRDLFQNYPAFAKFLPEIKKKTSYLTEATINLIYKVLNLNPDDLNDKYNIINKTEKGMIINQYNISNIAQENYQKFNIHQSFVENGNIVNQYDEKINKWFDYCKEFHSFVPNNSADNIIKNTSQIIQRKFFEFLFKVFFSDVITIEVEKKKTLTSDEFHEILRILRRMKKILFNDKNQNLYKDLEFLNEEKSSFDLNNLS